MDTTSISMRQPLVMTHFSFRNRDDNVLSTISDGYCGHLFERRKTHRIRAGNSETMLTAETVEAIAHQSKAVVLKHSMKLGNGENMVNMCKNLY